VFPVLLNLHDVLLLLLLLLLLVIVILLPIDKRLSV
jgi:hypothetical protein